MSARPAARHREAARTAFRGLLWRFFWKLQWRYFPLLLSDYGREILRRKYDAIATDRAYENVPSGVLGPIGRAVDRMVLAFPLHVGLRQRLRLVVDALAEEVTRRRDRAEIRLLSAPCGLARDVVLLAGEVRRREASLAARLRVDALDLDETGEVLPLAAARAAAAGVTIAFHRADLFDEAALRAALGDARFDVVSCIGLSAWLDLADVERLARHFHDRLLVAGGTLVVDNFARHEHSHLGADLEMNTRYHDPSDFASAVARAGFDLVRATPTENGVNTVHVFAAR